MQFINFNRFSNFSAFHDIIISKKLFQNKFNCFYLDNCQLNPHLSDPDAILILISKLSKKDIITKQFQVPRSDSLSPKCCCHHFSEDYQPLCPGPCSTKFHIKRELHRSTLLFSHSVSRRFLDPNKKVADGCIFFLIFSKEIERCKDY